MRHVGNRLTHMPTHTHLHRHSLTFVLLSPWVLCIPFICDFNILTLTFALQLASQVAYLPDPKSNLNSANGAQAFVLINSGFPLSSVYQEKGQKSSLPGSKNVYTHTHV